MSEKNKKEKKPGTSPKKAKRDSIIQHIRHALEEWKDEWPLKKFESRVKKAAKLFMDGKSLKPKNKGKQKAAAGSSSISSE